MRKTTHRRLQRRARSGETVDAVVTRLLDETIDEVDLETVLSTIDNEFESAVSIYVNHSPSIENLSQLRFVVYTGEADSLEDTVDLFEPNQRIVIERDNDDMLKLSFSVIASFGGPQSRDTAMGTPVYMHENVIGAQPLDLEVGTAYLKDKLANPDQWDDEPVAEPIKHINEQVE